MYKCMKCKRQLIGDPYWIEPDRDEDGNICGQIETNTLCRPCWEEREQQRDTQEIEADKIKKQTDIEKKMLDVTYRLNELESQMIKCLAELKNITEYLKREPWNEHPGF